MPSVSENPGPRISPYYRRYLKEQIRHIRANGGDDEAARQFVQIDMKAPVSARVTPIIDEVWGDDTPSQLRGVSMALVQGATYGFGDEAVGGMLGALTGVGARQGIEEYRREYASWAKENRALSIGAELVGGLTTGGIGGAAQKGILAAVGRGMVHGAVGGFGAGDNTELSWDMVGDRTKSALIGMLAGGVVGGTIATGPTGVGAIAGSMVGGFPGAAIGGAAGALVSRIPRKIIDSEFASRIGRAAANIPGLRTFHEVSPEGRAYETIAARIRATHGDVTKAIDEGLVLADGYAARQQRATMLDVFNDSFLKFGTEVMGTRTPRVQAVLKGFEQRENAAPEQLLGQLFARVLTTPKLGVANIYSVERKLHAQAGRAASPFYKDAHEQMVPTSANMRHYLTRPDFVEAWNHGADIANREIRTGRATGLEVPLIDVKAATKRAATRAKYLAQGISREQIDKTFPEIQALPDELPVRGIDYLKRTLQEPVMKRYQNRDLAPATRKIRDQELDTLEDEYKSILNETIERVPVFGKALASYSGPVTSRDAVSRGYERFIADDSWYDVMRDMKRLSPQDRDFYRVGAVRAYYDRMLQNDDPKTDIAKKLFGAALLSFDDAGRQTGRLNNDARRVLALFHGNKPAANDFLRVVAGQARLAKSTGSTLRLPKNIRTEEAAEANVASTVGSGLGVTIANTARRSVRSEQAQLSRVENDAISELLGQGLHDPDHLRVVLETIKYNETRRRSYLSARMQRSIAQKVGRTAAELF